MSERAWTEWLSSAETQMLLRYLRRRKATVTGAFLSGEVVDPVHQGRAAAYNELEVLLSKPADEVRKILKGE